MSGEDPLSSSQMAVFSLGPQLAEGPRELPGVFFFFLNKGTDPIHDLNTPQRLHLKTPSPCRAGFNTRTWGQDIGLSLRVSFYEALGPSDADRN